MTDFSDGVEQNRVVILGYGPQVKQDEPLLDPCHNGRVSEPEGLGQAGFRTKGSRKRGRESDGRAGYRLIRRAAAAKIRLDWHDRDIATRPRAKGLRETRSAGLQDRNGHA